jgi:hypothetical protein
LPSFLQNTLSFVSAAIQIAPVSDARFKVADSISELPNFGIDPVLTSGSIPATAIKRAVNLSLKFLGESIEPVYGVAHIAIIVTPVAITLIVRVSVPLSGCCCGQT